MTSCIAVSAAVAPQLANSRAQISSRRPGAFLGRIDPVPESYRQRSKGLSCIGYVRIG
jgi:hypothetical protein